MKNTEVNGAILEDERTRNGCHELEGEPIIQNIGVPTLINIIGFVEEKTGVKHIY